MARLLGWKALADAGQWEALLAAIVRDSGIVCRELFLRTTERHLTNYLHLLELLQEEAARTPGTIRELAGTLGAWISRERQPPGQGTDIQRLETDARAVQIMTIHQSKGLEAAVVFVYGGFWPGGGGAWVHASHDAEGRRVVRVGKRVTDAEKAREAEEQDDEERRVLYVALTRARGRLYLPRYPREFKKLKGSYRFVNERLDALLGGFVPERQQALFPRVRLPCPGGAPTEPIVASSAVLAAWRPDPALLAPDPPDDELRAIATTRAGFAVTSYSTVKRRHGGFVAPAPLDDPAANEDAGASLVALPEDELPRGRLSGSFLHAVLEEVDLASLRGTTSANEWRARPDVAALLARLSRRHDRSAMHLPHAARLVHTALATPLRLGEALVPGPVRCRAGAARARVPVPDPREEPAAARRCCRGRCAFPDPARRGQGIHRSPVRARRPHLRVRLEGRLVALMGVGAGRRALSGQLRRASAHLHLGSAPSRPARRRARVHGALRRRPLLLSARPPCGRSRRGCFLSPAPLG